jgi:hypothetical protein
MTTTLGGKVAGWYLDPTERHEERFFNGLIWTAWAKASGVEIEDPLPEDEVGFFPAPHGLPLWAEVRPDPPAVPAGWYRDPTERHDHRFFDGKRWTDQAGSAGQTIIDLVSGGALEFLPKPHEVIAPAPADVPTTEPRTVTRELPHRAAAGWYVDPSPRGDHRYWDGQAWTNQISKKVRGRRDRYHARKDRQGTRGITAQMAPTGTPIVGGPASVHRPSPTRRPRRRSITGAGSGWYVDPSPRGDHRYWDGQALRRG